MSHAMSELNSQAAAEDRHHRELLARTARGSVEAFNELYTLLYTPLVRFLYRFTQSSALAEEILDDTLMVVWQKAGTFRGDSRALTWVLGIAGRRALKSVRQERHCASPRNCLFPGSTAANELSQLATREALEWALQQLNTEQRLAIEMAYFHGLNCEEIASVLGCPLNTAKTRLHYARRRLRKIFGSAGEPLDFADLDEAMAP